MWLAGDAQAQVIEGLIQLARELAETVRNNVRIDWTLRENVRANLRRLVKRILRKHGYPPDKQERATRTVLEQVEVLSAGRVRGPHSAHQGPSTPSGMTPTPSGRWYP